jgi:hypothetical protein
MAYARSLLQAFDARNDIYAGGVVAAYATDGAGNATTTLIPLYAGPSGATVLANPQVLNGHGQFQQPVYFDTPCILRVSSAFAASHDSGQVTPNLSSADVSASAMSAAAAAASLAAVQQVAASVNPLDPNTLVTPRDYPFNTAN